MLKKLKLLFFRWLGFLKIDYVVNCEAAERDGQLEDLVRDAITNTLLYENVFRPVYVSVTICNPDYIRSLNRNFREKDVETDVLSFPLWEKREMPPRGILELGDIVLSYHRAEEQAKELGHSFHREAAFLAIHSTLHLLGYDHELSAEDDEDMCFRQNQIIKMMHLPLARDTRKDFKI